MYMAEVDAGKGGLDAESIRVGLERPDRAVGMDAAHSDRQGLNASASEMVGLGAGRSLCALEEIDDDVLVQFIEIEDGSGSLRDRATVAPDYGDSQP